jgi:predicted transcriptional regulator
LSVKTSWQLLRGAVQERAKAPGRVAAANLAWSWFESKLGALKAPSGDSAREPRRLSGPQSTRRLLETLYAFAADGARLHATSVGRRLTAFVDAPYAGFVNLQVPPEREAKLTRLAAETGRTADQVALDLLASSIDRDEWFRTEVEKGRVSAREGRLIDHDDVAARMERRYRG